MTDPIHIEREVPGLGHIEFEQAFNADGTTKRGSRNYWFTPEDGVRRRRFPSVTDIIRDTWPKPALLGWYAKWGGAAEGMLEEASRRGTAAHLFVEHYLRTGDVLELDQYPEAWLPYFQGLAAFLFEYDPEPVAIEQLIVHPELGFAGRPDLIAIVHGQRTLLDFKTNPKGRIYTEAHVQATAYRAGLERCGDERVQQTLLVGVSDTGELNVVIGADFSKLWGCVLAFYSELKRAEKALNGWES